MSFINNDYNFVKHLSRMTDDVGIFQHTVYGIPDPNKGYTTDDNSRALILAVLLYEKFKDEKYLNLISRYLTFLLYAQNEDGKFKNFMGYNKEFLEDEGSEDSWGRCIWALCRTGTSNAVPENIKRTCMIMVNRFTKKIPEIISPRAMAGTIIGLSYLEDAGSKTALPYLKRAEKISEYIDKLSSKLLIFYEYNSDKDWHWFEGYMTYGNSLFPWSLFRAYKVLGKEKLLNVASESMGFLLKVTMKNDYYKPIGCDGWLQKGGKAAEYDEQTLEAAETMLALLEYYNISGDSKHLNDALTCFEWYKGKNSIKTPLIDEETGGCFDGINSNGLNLNQGAESIVSYGISVMEITKYLK